MNSRFRLDTRRLIQASAWLCVLFYLVCWVKGLNRDEFSLSLALRSLWQIEDGEILRVMGALYGPAVWVDGEWWRILTLGLLHGSVIHLAFNLIALFSLSPWLSQLLGPAAYLWWLASSILCSGLASLFWADMGLVVGISGGIFGLAGGLMTARLFGRSQVRDLLDDLPLRQLSVGLGLVLFLGSFIDQIPGFPKLANAGHWGGFIAGGLLGLIHFGRKSLWRFGSGLLMALGFLILGAGAYRPDFRENYLETMAYYYFEAKEFEPAERHFRELLTRRPEDPLLENALAYLLSESGGDLVEAESLIRKAIRQLPENPDLLDTYGWLRCLQGRRVEGLEILERARSLDLSGNSEILGHISECTALMSSNPGSDAGDDWE